MSGGFVMLPGAANLASIGAVNSASTLTVLTAPGSTNTKGAWTQLIASTANDINGFIYKCLHGGVAESVLMDLAIGPGGSEQIIFADIACGRDNDYTQFDLFVPLAIPAGTRIAARYQTSNLSGAEWAGIIAFDGSFTATQAGVIETMGTVAANSRGTALQGGSANVKGAWTQITASTANDYIGIMASWDDGGVGSSANTIVDIGAGGSGSEVVIVPDYYVRGNSEPPMPFVGVPIPAGTRIAARAQNGGTNATQCGISVHGVR